MANRPVCPAAVALVQQFEGLPGGQSGGTIRPYLDPIGIWTIGWGHAITVQGQFLRGAANSAEAQALFPNGLTLASAQALLASDLADAGSSVTALVTVPLNDNQFGALTSFTFNLGAGNLRASTLLIKLNNSDYSGAADQFLVWVNAGGQPLPGLVARRQAERALFLTPQAPATASTTASAPSVDTTIGTATASISTTTAGSTTA